MRDVRLVTSEPRLFRTHGRRLWMLTGALASADFLVGDTPVDAYGIDPNGLPPRFSLNALPTRTAAARPPATIALVALSESPAGLASVVERALNRVVIDAATVVAIIHPDISTGPETTRDILLESLQPALRDRVQVAEPSSDGVAGGLVAQADIVIAARTSDLAVRAVADAAARVGSIVLDETGPEVPRFTGAALRKAHHAQPALVPVDQPLADLVPIIDGLTGRIPSVVLHSREADGLARRLWRLPGSSRAGLLLVCDTGPYLGEADPARPAFNLLGFGMESWPSVRRLLLAGQTLHDVVEAAASLTHAHRTNLLAVPASGVSHGPLGPETKELPAWVTDAGILPPPNLAGLTDVDPVEPDYQPEPDDPDIKQWAETHGFRDRIRLALPWKWGLLARAMRDRW
jgi:hypothetical protein